jgi:hypothetical protein
MQKRTGQVLKSDQVELGGKFQLNQGQTQVSKARPNNPVSAAPQVRILENNPEYAVIGVTCCCGTEFSIRCDYADAQASGHPET